MSQLDTAEDRIKQFVRQHFPRALKNGADPNEKWLENGAIDSLGILDLVHFLEKEFSLQVSDDDLMPEHFESLAAVTNFVQQKSPRKS